MKNVNCAREGSITVFLALTLVLVLSFIFSLLEGARIYCLKVKAETVTRQCIQSMFGSYHGGLWEDYHLLFLDGSWQEGEFSIGKFSGRAMEELRENLFWRGENPGEKGWDLTSLTPRNVEVLSYQLATDNGGQVFQSQVALQMKLEAASDALDELFQLKEKGSQVKEQTAEKESRWEQAWDAMEEAEEIKEEQEAETAGGESAGGESTGGESTGGESAGGEGTTTEEPLENPMDYVKELKSSTMLGLVVSDPSALSGKALEKGDFLEKRTLPNGNWIQTPQSGIMDRLWLQYYIENYFSNYTRESEKGPKEKGLDYEMEYLLAGKTSDVQNLEIVVYQLLGVREVMNFLTIMQDGGKKSMALSIATAAVGFTGIMPLIQAVQIGILLAWAFIESVLDVRTLLEGKRIPLLKRTDQWASDLTDCKSTVESGAKSEEDGEGLSYSQYLQILLFLLSEKTINYRCMDVIGRNERVSMENMVQSVEGDFSYEAEPLFWTLNMLVPGGWDYFSFQKQETILYGV